MKPIRMVEEVVRTRVYWTCACERHRHTTEAIAAACRKDSERWKKPKNQWTDERLASILLERRADPKRWTYKALGQKYGGVGPARIQQVLAKAERIERNRQQSRT